MKKRQEKKNRATFNRKNNGIVGRLTSILLFGGEAEPWKPKRVPRRSFKRGCKLEKKRYFIHIIGLGEPG